MMKRPNREHREKTAPFRQEKEKNQNATVSSCNMFDFVMSY